MKKSSVCYVIQLIFIGFLGVLLAWCGIDVREQPLLFFSILGVVLAYGLAVRAECQFVIVETAEKIFARNEEMKKDVAIIKEKLRGKDDP